MTPFFWCFWLFYFVFYSFSKGFFWAVWSWFGALMAVLVAGFFRTWYSNLEGSMETQKEHRGVRSVLGSKMIQKAMRLSRRFEDSRDLQQLGAEYCCQQVQWFGGPTPFAPWRCEMWQKIDRWVSIASSAPVNKASLVGFWSFFLFFFSLQRNFVESVGTT